jgi:hypothetical protein
VNADSLSVGKEVGLEINIEKLSMCCCLVTRVQVKIITKIANRWFENVAQFKYLASTVANQNLILEEIKRRLNSGNACYHSAQNLLSSCLLSKNVKIKIYKTIILPAVLMSVKLGLWH